MSPSTTGAWRLLVLLGALCSACVAPEPQAEPAVPTFRVDPSWPRIPNNWQFGQVASVSIDAADHVWVLQRPRHAEP